MNREDEKWVKDKINGQLSYLCILLAFMFVGVILACGNLQDRLEKAEQKIEALQKVEP